MNFVEKKYSVLMSVYFRENPEWFDSSMKSMFEQTIKPNEFILVEDGKLTEELYKVVDKYRKMYPNIMKIIEIEKNVGLGPALKLGVENCSYDWIARMDSDDYSVPNRIEKQFEYIKNNPNVDIVGSSIAEFIGDIRNVISYRDLPETNDEILSYSKKRNPFGHPSVLMRKKAVLEVGNYREYHLVEDYDLWTRMLNNGSNAYNFKECLVFMRIGDDFYKRRGGIKYLKSILRFKKNQYRTGYFTITDYLISSISSIVVCLMPNFIRDIIYKKLLRKKKDK